MTVPYGYTADLWNLFWRWRGSVWKKCAKPYLLFISAYYAIFVTVHHLLPANQRDDFERTTLAMSKLPSRIPIQFLLGFYINQVLSRWWDQLSSISFPDKFLHHVNAYLPGRETSRRLIRRTFARLAMLQCLACWKEVSLKVRRRFPTTEHLRDCGIMTEHEFEMWMNTDSTQSRWFLPTSWMNNLVVKLYVAGDISERGMSELIREICTIRSEVGMLTVYDWINLPLVYAQVAKLVTYGYFLFNLLSQQPISEQIVITKPTQHRGDFGTVNTSFPFPLIISLEFLFYIGWLKVGDEILSVWSLDSKNIASESPFGDRDEDFDMNYVVDRNMQIGFMIVDSLADQTPSIEKDRWWGQGEHIELPHTRGSRRIAHTDSVPEWNYDPIFIPRSEQCWEHAAPAAKKSHGAATSNSSDWFLSGGKTSQPNTMASQLTRRLHNAPGSDEAAPHLRRKMEYEVTL